MSHAIEQDPRFLLASLRRLVACKAAIGTPESLSFSRRPEGQRGNIVRVEKKPQLAFATVLDWNELYFSDTVIIIYIEINDRQAGGNEVRKNAPVDRADSGQRI